MWTDVDLADLQTAADAETSRQAHAHPRAAHTGSPVNRRRQPAGTVMADVADAVADVQGQVGDDD